VHPPASSLMHAGQGMMSACTGHGQQGEGVATQSRFQGPMGGTSGVYGWASPPTHFGPVPGACMSSCMWGQDGAAHVNCAAGRRQGGAVSGGDDSGSCRARGAGSLNSKWSDFLDAEDEEEGESTAKGCDLDERGFVTAL